MAAHTRCGEFLEGCGCTTRRGDLTPYGLFILGAGIGAAAGVLIRVWKELLFCLLELFWGSLPAALDAAGWSPDSAFSLVNFFWIGSAAISVLVGLLSVPLLDSVPAANLGAWTRHLHRSSTGTVPFTSHSGVRCISLDWVGGFALLALLSALSGASLGPEPFVVIAPSALAGAFAAGPLKQGPQVARAAALAGGAGGLSAFFGLPVASAFAVLEIPDMDGMPYAMEAMPACLVASLTGAIFGRSLFASKELLGDSERGFPGAMNTAQGEAGNREFGLGALLWAAPAGLAAGVCIHLLVIAIKSLHHPVSKLRGGDNGHVTSPTVTRWKRAALLAVVGAINGGAAIFIPGSFFWGEQQLQVALTRGCEGYLGEEPVELPWLYPGLLRHSLPSQLPSHPCGASPLSASSMLALFAVKISLILLGELSGFVGGAIYPTVFATACLGSAIGAIPWVTSLGPQYVYISTAAAISVGLASLLNAKTFAVLFVLVLQDKVPPNNTSAQLMALLFAVSVHYLLSRCFIHKFPHFNMIATQEGRQDLNSQTLSRTMQRDAPFGLIEAEESFRDAGDLHAAGDNTSPFNLGGSTRSPASSIDDDDDEETSGSDRSGRSETTPQADEELPRGSARSAGARSA